jgi:hypothetical protein
MVVDKVHATESITDLVTTHVEGARLRRTHGKEVAYTDSGGTYQRRKKEHPKKTTNHTYVDVNQTTIRWWLPLICFKMLLLTTIRWWLPLTCFKMLLLTTQ